MLRCAVKTRLCLAERLLRGVDGWCGLGYECMEAARCGLRRLGLGTAWQGRVWLRRPRRFGAVQETEAYFVELLPHGGAMSSKAAGFGPDTALGMGTDRHAGILRGLPRPAAFGGGRSAGTGKQEYAPVGMVGTCYRWQDGAGEKAQALPSHISGFWSG